MSEFEKVCALDELTAGTAALAEVGGVRMAIVRTDDDEVYAINDTCSHANVSLSEGEVDGCFLECWLHGSRFDLRTGVPKTPPATRPVATYQVRVADGEVYVAVPQTTGA